MKIVQKAYKKLSVFLLLIPTLYLASCATEAPENAKGLTKIRSNAIQDAATTYGAQLGLALESILINKVSGNHARKLDQIFNFNRIMLAHNVLPPVLVESRNNLNLDSPNTIRLSDRTYQIIALAHFTTTYPSWRDYLTLAYKKPQEPSPTLYPQTAEERSVWDKYLVVGWKSGIRQAEEIFKEDLSRLTRDFKGMVLYHVLAAKHIIDEPYVAKASLGIVGNPQELHINTQILRITKNANLQMNSHLWKPGLSHETIERTMPSRAPDLPAKLLHEPSKKAQLYRSTHSSKSK